MASQQQPQPVPISYHIQPAMFAGIEQRARTMNLRPAEYARQLMESAYRARQRHEQGSGCGDAALDRQVKQVFLLADCEAEYIAEALAIPQERVERILAAWRSDGWRGEPSLAQTLLPPPCCSGDGFRHGRLSRRADPRIVGGRQDGPRDRKGHRQDRGRFHHVGVETSRRLPQARSARPQERG